MKLGFGHDNAKVEHQNKDQNKVQNKDEDV